jgi:hypothetical protein
MLTGCVEENCFLDPRGPQKLFYSVCQLFDTQLWVLVRRVSIRVTPQRGNFKSLKLRRNLTETISRFAISFLSNRSAKPRDWDF